MGRPAPSAAARERLSSCVRRMPASNMVEISERFSISLIAVGKARMARGRANICLPMALSTKPLSMKLTSS